jgi:hypothetical protein
MLCTKSGIAHPPSSLASNLNQAHVETIFTSTSNFRVVSSNSAAAASLFFPDVRKARS